MCTESLEAGDRGLSLKESLAKGVPHPGLPGPLPFGEQIQWQAAPDWWQLGKQLFLLHWVLGYFVLVGSWRALASYYDGATGSEAVLAMLPSLIIGLLVFGLLALLALVSARATIYTITNRRVVMRIGAALSKIVDIPFETIESVQLKRGLSDSGDLALSLKQDKQVPYIVLWPYARAWRVRSPEPLLLALPDARAAAQCLTHYLTRFRAETQPIQPSAVNAQDPWAEHETGRPAALTAATAASLSVPAPEQHSHGSHHSHGPAHQHPHDHSHRHHSHEVLGTNGRWPMRAAFALTICALATVSWMSVKGSSGGDPSLTTPTQVIELRFDKSTVDGRIAIVLLREERIITHVEPGKDGLINGALRGLEHARRAYQKPLDAPVQFVVWQSGRITLSDLSIDQHIPLDAFGPTVTGALAGLLNLRTEELPGDLALSYAE